MISLEEQSKICNLIASCNDMINGKFILIDYKISNILKNITDSKEIYNLISNCMSDFSFEREFSKAQLRSSNSKNFSLPKEPEKILPFVFCILFSIKNKNIDVDAFLKEFYQSEKGRADEYLKFATEIILPFRNIIANYFEIDLSEKDLFKNVEENLQNKTLNQENEMLTEQTNLQSHKNLTPQNQSKTKERAEQILQITKKSTIEKKINSTETKKERQLQFDEENFFENNKKELIDNLFPQNKNLTNNENIYEEDTNNIDDLFDEIQEICTNIISELNQVKRIKGNLKDNIIYIAQTIHYNCKQKDLRNISALITAFEYIASPIRSIRFLTKELKNLLAEFYN